MKIIRKMKFIKTLRLSIQHEIYFQLKNKSFEPGHVIYKEGDRCEEFCILRTGVIEVFTDFEGTDFVLDLIFPGSIINLNNFLLEDDLSVGFRAK